MLVLLDYLEQAVPSNPLVSKSRPDSIDGVAVNGHNHNKGVPPIPCLIFCIIPIS